MIVAAPLANLVIRRLGGNADRQEVAVGSTHAD
jgi:hypothetical protein